MKAMTYGTIPITSRLTESVLPQVTRYYDLGPKTPLTLQQVYNGQLLASWLKDEYLPALIAATRMSAVDLYEHRKKMKEYAFNSFSWNKTTDLFTLFVQQSIHNRKQLNILHD